MEPGGVGLTCHEPWVFWQPVSKALGRLAGLALDDLLELCTGRAGSILVGQPLGQPTLHAASAIGDLWKCPCMAESGERQQTCPLSSAGWVCAYLEQADHVLLICKERACRQWGRCCLRNGRLAPPLQQVLEPCLHPLRLSWLLHMRQPARSLVDRLMASIVPTLTWLGRTFCASSSRLRSSDFSKQSR